MAEQTRSECIANSYFINYYFNSLNKRMDGNKKLLITDYLIIYSYYILCLKYFMMLFIEFDYETRLILFDLSLFMGGIQKYDLFVCILGFILGTKFYILLYSVSQRDLIWIKLLYMSNEGIPQNLDRREKLIYRKTFSISRIIYKIIDLAIMSFGKFSNFINPF
jgi:hypothetical protein